MKKILIFLIPLIFITGCSIERIDNKGNTKIINTILGNKIKKANTVGMGYKYYLPADVIRTSSISGNEILSAKGYKYYLYVDITAYKNKKPIKYTKKSKVYYDLVLDDKKNNGYINIINTQNDVYLIEYIYNYAKIEVEVEEKDIKDALINSSYILKNVTFNNKTIANMGEDNVLSNPEKPYVISKNAVKENSNFLEYLEKYDKYEGEVIPNENIVITEEDEEEDNVIIEDVEKGIISEETE